MKNDSLLRTLAGAQVAVGLCLASLCAWHIYGTRVLSRQARQLVELNQNKRALQQLVAASVDYGRTQAGIHPLLQSLNIRMTANPAPMLKPQGDQH